jgi:DNA polymerase/3'-5' exonuclease PolX
MNQEIIKNLKIIQEFEKLQNSPYAANAYKKVIENIELYGKEIKTVEDLHNIKGIGKGISQKLTEFLETGKMSIIDTILQDEKYILGQKLLNIYGVGPAKVDDLLKEISSFDELFLPENDKLLNDKQKIGLKYFEDLQTRIPIAEGKEHFKIIQKAVKKVDKNATFEIVGSYRRKNKDMGDIDVLIKDTPDKFSLKSFISNLQESGYIVETLAAGKNKFMGICRLHSDLPARRIDILVTDPEHYYFALLYFTGSYSFNIYMRRIALQKNLSLSEYGFKDNNRKLIDSSSIKSEEDIFNYLEIPYVPPQKR